MTAEAARDPGARPDVIEDPVLRHRLRFERATDEGGELLRVEFWVDPGGGVPPHVHPAMEERFHVLEGRPQFLGGRRWSTASPGETVVVPAGTRHAYRNRSEGTAHVVCESRPPSTLEEFLTDAAALARAGKLTPRALPTSFDGLLQAAVMAHSYRDMVVLRSFPLPPPFIQRLVFPPLARWGERRGYRAGHFSELY